MAGIAATYVSATEFILSGDQTGSFDAYRRVKADCGADGYQYSAVDSSSYDSGADTTTVNLLDSVLTSNLVGVWFGMISSSQANGATPLRGIRRYVLDNLPNDLDLNYDGDSRGANSINVQPGRLNTGNVAYGQGGIAVGYDTQAGYYGTAVGYKAKGTGTSCVAVGHSSAASGSWTVAIGLRTQSEGNSSVAIGYEAHGNGGVAIGSGAYSKDGVAIGPGANTNWGGYAIGYNAYTGWAGVAVGGSAHAYDLGIAIGYGAKSLIGYTAVIAGCITTRKTASAWGSDPICEFSSAEATIMSDIVDLTAAGDTEISLPSGVHFFPNEVGVIVTVADTVSGQPSLSFGEGTGSLDTLSTAAATSGLDSASARERRTSLSKGSGVTTLSASVTAAGSATSLSGRFYFQGLLVEDE